VCFFFVAKNRGGGIQVYVWKETDSNDDIVRYGMDGDGDDNCSVVIVDSSDGILCV
jgi:hypothetical protein